MKWLLNMNIPRRLKYYLESVGHQCRHVGDIGLGTADDWTVLKEAAEKGETILTHDLDYGQLLAFSGVTQPSVLIVRLSRPHPESIFKRLMAVWTIIEQPLKIGAIVVLDDATVRIRELPIRR